MVRTGELRASATSGQGSHYSDANSEGGWSDISSPVKGGLNPSTAVEPAEPRGTSATGARQDHAARDPQQQQHAKHAKHVQPLPEQGAAATQQQSEQVAGMQQQQHEVHSQQQQQVRGEHPDHHHQQEQQQQHRSAGRNSQAADSLPQLDGVPADPSRGKRGRRASQAEATVTPPLDDSTFAVDDEAAARKRCGEAAIGSAGCSEGSLKLLLYPGRMLNIPLVQVHLRTGLSLLLHLGRQDKYASSEIAS